MQLDLTKLQNASTASCCPLSLFNLRKNQLDFRSELLIKNDHEKERYLHFCGYYTYIHNWLLQQFRQDYNPPSYT